MSALQVLKNHYEGKKIVGGINKSYIGWEIINVSIDSYEPMMEFTVKKDGKVCSVTILFEWDIEVAP